MIFLFDRLFHPTNVDESDCRVKIYEYHPTIFVNIYIVYMDLHMVSLRKEWYVYRAALEYRHETVAEPNEICIRTLMYEP